jgi:hypothetical protein
VSVKPGGSDIVDGGAVEDEVLLVDEVEDEDGDTVTALEVDVEVDEVVDVVELIADVVEVVDMVEMVEVVKLDEVDLEDELDVVDSKGGAAPHEPNSDRH